MRPGPVGDVIAAVATPPGKGAIGVVRLSGPGARAAADRFLEAPRKWPPRRARLMWAVDGERRLDQVLAMYFPPGSSFTGEETLEISAHGSPYILERLLRLALDAGARLARPGEFTQRAYLNGKLDLTQAEAVCDLINARTRLAHRAAVAQLEGGLSLKAAALRAETLDLAAWVEATLDHPDEDIPLLSDAEAAGRLDGLLASTRALTDSRHRGRLARSGIRIAIVGRPNAGKSSLLNALIGRERAIVAKSPGTTRDTIEESADIGGLETVLVDTAGFRPGARDPVEREGQKRTRAELRRADVALWVLDRTAAPRRRPGLLREMNSMVQETDRAAIAVLNKSDLLPAGFTPEDVGSRVPAVEVSARTGAGIPELILRIRRSIQCETEDGVDPVLLISERHYAALIDVQRALESAREVLRERPGDHAEFTASHLHAALEALDTLLGEKKSGAVLDEIFSRFCVGK